MAYVLGRKNPITTKTNTGSILTFNSALPIVPDSVISQITGWQEGSGNPYPAGGSAQIWDEEWENGTINSTTGENEPNSAYIRSKNYIRINPNTEYFYKTSAVLRLVYYDVNKDFVGIANANNATVLSPANAYYVRFYPNTSSYGSSYKNDISINYPATDTEYHPYSNIRQLHAFSEGSIGRCNSATAQLWTVDSSFKGDVLFNQIYNYNAINTTRLGVSRSITNGFIEFSGETTEAGNSVIFAWTDLTIPNGHKVIVLKDFDLPDGDYIMDQYSYYSETDITNTIITIRAGYLIPQLKVTGAGHDYTGISGHLSVIDLTVMFGSTIADYIYNLETQTAGAGVAFFKAIYPDDYYAYNAGTKQLVGDTLAIFTFGQDIYSGYIDWKRGVVVGEKVILKDYTNIYFYTSQTYPTTRSYRLVTPKERAVDTFCLSNKFKFAVLGANTPYCMEVAATATEWVRKSIFFELPDDYDTVEKAKQYLIDNDVQFAYSLFTPIEIQLTPQIIGLVQGQNNIFCDTGSTTIIRKDVQ